VIANRFARLAVASLAGLLAGACLAAAFLTMLGG
jgi:hypothetical protein